jgi:hypothetical protein
LGVGGVFVGVFVSVGLVSVGLVSVGLVSVGLVSVGLVSVGLVSVGLVSVGLVSGDLVSPFLTLSFDVFFEGSVGVSPVVVGFALSVAFTVALSGAGVGEGVAVA